MAPFTTNRSGRRAAQFVFAFIFVDLIILPILDIYRCYYGLRVAGCLLVIFYCSPLSCPGMPIRVRVRRHLPIVASVLVVIVCLASAGTTCVCVVGHHPNHAVEQVASAIPAALPAPPPTAWTLAMVATVTGLMVVAVRRRSSGRASPEMLQRFLF
jgi:hypothetical protein